MMLIETEHINVSVAVAPPTPDSSPDTQVSGNGEVPAQSTASNTATEKPVVVHLSPEAMALLEEGAGRKAAPDSTTVDNASTSNFDDPEAIFGDSKVEIKEGSGVELTAPPTLSAGERAQLAQMRMQDAAVRSQQFSRIALAGSLAGTQSTELTPGPDGQLYATNGNVDVDTTPGSTPEESLSRASILRRVSSTASTTAQATTSHQENVAVQAAQIEFAARSELNAHILSKMVFAVENNIEVDHRDSGAANEAANWSSFPEFNANALHNDTGAEAGADEETIMTGAEAVVAADRSSSTQDERRGLSSNLRNLFHDPSSRAQSKTSLDIVA